MGRNPKLHHDVPTAGTLDTMVDWRPQQARHDGRPIGRNAPPNVMVRDTWAVGAKGASQRLGAGLAVKRRYGENQLMSLLRQNTGTIQGVLTALAKIGVNI